MTVNNGKSNSQSTPIPHDHVLFTDLDGLEGVLVDLNTKKYYQLNETASLVWRGLEKCRLVTSQRRSRISMTSLERATLSVETAVPVLRRRSCCAGVNS